jgi:hypothetical protein
MERKVIASFADLKAVIAPLYFVACSDGDSLLWLS